jgi:3-methyladenine DNA glycosylase Mpg
LRSESDQSYRFSIDIILCAAKSPLDQPDVLTTMRIGVTSAKDELLRFCYADNPYVSGPRRLRTRQQ